MFVFVAPSLLKGLEIHKAQLRFLFFFMPFSWCFVALVPLATQSVLRNDVNHHVTNNDRF